MGAAGFAIPLPLGGGSVNQITCFQSGGQIGYREQRRLNQIGDKLRKRFAAFLRMRTEAEEDLNPFGDRSKMPSALLCYVLWCIDKLPASDAAILRASTPHLQIEHHQDGDWQHIVAAVMGLDDDWRQRILTLWERNCQIAGSCGVPLTPRQFAEHVIERNFGLSPAFVSKVSRSFPDQVHRRS
jgi:hypothetical protein